MKIIFVFVLLNTPALTLWHITIILVFVRIFFRNFLLDRLIVEWIKQCTDVAMLYKRLGL